MKNLNEDKDYEDKKEQAGKFSLVIVLVVLVVFFVILMFTDIVGNLLGKTAENIALIAVAVVLVIMLYKTKKD